MKSPAGGLAHVEELVFQTLGQISLWHDAQIGHYECAVQKASYGRRRIRTKHAPSGVILSQQIEGGKI